MTTDQSRFVASRCSIGTHNDGRYITLDFMNNNFQAQSIALDRTSIPTILAELHAEIRAGGVVPINQASLRGGVEFRLTSFVMRKLRCGISCLVLYLEPPKGQTVIVEIPLNTSDVSALILELFRVAN